MTSRRPPITFTSSCSIATKEIYPNILKRKRPCQKRKPSNSSYRYSMPSRPLSRTRSCTEILNWQTSSCMTEKSKSPTLASQNYSLMNNLQKQCWDRLLIWLPRFSEEISTIIKPTFGPSESFFMKSSSDCKNSFI